MFISDVKQSLIHSVYFITSLTPIKLCIRMVQTRVSVQRAHIYTQFIFYKSRHVHGKLRTHISMPILCVRNIYALGPQVWNMITSSMFATHIKHTNIHLEECYNPQVCIQGTKTHIMKLFKLLKINLALSLIGCNMQHFSPISKWVPIFIGLREQQ